MSAQRHCLEIEIVEDVLSDAQVRELRAFAVMARGEFLGLDVHVPPLFAGSHVAIAWLQRKGLLAGAKLTFAGWKYLASIDRIPFAAAECACCGCTDVDCSKCIARTGVACCWLDDDDTLCSACSDVLPHEDGR